MRKKIISINSENAPGRPLQKGGQREDRLATELKENLKKRKAQARALGRAPVKQIKEI